MSDKESFVKEGLVGSIAPAPSKTFEKTPFFTATHAERYLRQALIREIEAVEPNRTLLCYVSGINTEVTRDDTVGFVDLLHNVRAGNSVDLMLHTGGGDLDAAEKLGSLIRETIGLEAQLRVIVPDYAKSAGTLMAIGGNPILMSDSSELGTIDPQVVLHDGCGNEICHSVLNYIKGYYAAKKALDDDPDDVAKRITFEKFDPTVLRKFEGIARRAREFAENQLKPYGAHYTAIASKLMNIDRFPSHRQMISWRAARDIGLNIEYLPQTDPRWRRYWNLYCLQRLVIGKNRKIFESDYVSLIIEEPSASGVAELPAEAGSQSP
jgi:hypothetical protein